MIFTDHTVNGRTGGPETEPGGTPSIDSEAPPILRWNEAYLQSVFSLGFVHVDKEWLFWNQFHVSVFMKSYVIIDKNLPCWFPWWRDPSFPSWRRAFSVMIKTLQKNSEQDHRYDSTEPSSGPCTFKVCVRPWLIYAFKSKNHQDSWGQAGLLMACGFKHECPPSRPCSLIFQRVL